MKVPIVIYGQNGRQEIGEVDVYANNWKKLPTPDHQLDLDLLVLSGDVEFIFSLKSVTAKVIALDEPKCICMEKGNACGGPWCHPSCEVCCPEEVKDGEVGAAE